MLKAQEKLINLQVIIRKQDLPLCCPMPSMTLWNMHPRVYLELKDGEAICPYCSTCYVLANDE